MIRSMTGYGRGEADLADRRIVVELRAVNHRFADVRLRLPQALTAHERELRQLVLAKVKRGRVDGWITVEQGDAAGAGSFNRTLYDEVRRTAEQLGQEGVSGQLDLGMVLGLPGLFRADPLEFEWTDEAIDRLREALGRAVTDFDEDRRREGSGLAEVLCARSETMQGLAAQLAERAAVLPGRLAERLTERLSGLSSGIELDAQRVAQEAVLLAERSDVTEELDRLRGHLEQLAQLTGQPDGEPLGKRLEFLLQEIQRETNTINSKSGDLQLSRTALALKSEAEKVREQVLNLE